MRTRSATWSSVSSHETSLVSVKLFASGENTTITLLWLLGQLTDSLPTQETQLRLYYHQRGATLVDEARGKLELWQEKALLRDDVKRTSTDLLPLENIKQALTFEIQSRGVIKVLTWPEKGEATREVGGE